MKRYPYPLNQILFTFLNTMKVTALLLTVIGLGVFEYSRKVDAAPGKVARSLKEIDHVVIFMQENRSWNTVCF